MVDGTLRFVTFLRTLPSFQVKRQEGRILVDMYEEDDDTGFNVHRNSFRWNHRTIFLVVSTPCVSRSFPFDCKRKR